MSGEDEKDSDKTPVEPLMERKKSSQTAMLAIGWRTCPACHGADVDCDVCFDPATKTFARRLPPDEYIKWIQKQNQGDTDPAPNFDRLADSDPAPKK
jgi:hypothetical protein